MSMTDTGQHGRPPRLVVGLMMAIISGLLVLAFIFQDRAAMANAAPGLAGAITFQLLAQGLGGFICGWLFAGLFGRGGAMGWALSLVSGVVVTLLAGALGGVLKSIPVILSQGIAFQEILNIAIGALAGPLAFDRNPLLAVAWVGLLLLTHIFALRQRRQHGTI